MSNLDTYRAQIDDIDRQLVALIEKRMGISKKVGEYKKANNLPVLDEKRETEVIKKRMEMLNNKEYKEDITKLFKLIMELSRSHQ